jgi:hypothetical protein
MRAEGKRLLTNEAVSGMGRVRSGRYLMLLVRRL